MVKRSDFTR